MFNWNKLWFLLFVVSVPLTSSAVEDYLIFEENKGQLFDYYGKPLNEVYFKAVRPGVTIYVTNRGLSYFFFSEKENEDEEADTPEHPIYEWRRIDMTLGESLIRKENIEQEEYQSITKNYYAEHCPNGVMNVRSCKKISIRNIYPMIDWVLYSDTMNGNAFKYDFIVHQGGDPSKINMNYEGNGSLQLSEEAKNINVHTRYGTLSEGKLICYQEKGDHIISSAYRMVDFNKKLFSSFFSAKISLDIPSWNPSMDLVIDPPVQLYQWGTYFGGNLLDGPMDIKVDQMTGDVYMAGYTNSTMNFPLKTASGAFYQGTTPDNGGDSFIARFDAGGVLMWCTYFGANGIDGASALAIAPDHSVYVTGITAASGMPVTPNGAAYFDNSLSGGRDAYVFRFSQTGARMWGTYFGGNGPNADLGKDIHVDKNGNVYVVGISGSTSGFPLVDGGGYYDNTLASGTYNMFIAKLDPNNSLTWGTFYGGNNADGAEGVLTDANGNIFVVGWSNSSTTAAVNFAGAYNNPTNSLGISNNASGQGDVVMMMFDASTNLKWATFYGGTGNDAATDLSISNNGSLYVTGWTNSSDFPTQTLNGAYNQTVYGGGSGGAFEKQGGDAFVLKFSPTQALLWATFYGGAGDELQTTSSYGDGVPAIECDAYGNTFIGGISCISGTSLPLKDPGNGAYFQNAMGGKSDMYIVQFNQQDTMIWGTYVGGTVSFVANETDFIRGLALNADGCLYVAGEFGSSNAPVKSLSGGYNQTQAGDDDGAILRFCPNQIPLDVKITNTDTRCFQSATGSVTVAATGGTPAYTYLWIPGNYTTSMATGLTAGVYTVKVTDVSATTVTKSITVSEPEELTFSLQATNASCGNINGVMEITSINGGTNPYTYLWSNGQTNLIVTGLAAGSYTVTLSDVNGCTQTASRQIQDIPSLTLDTAATLSGCSGNTGTATVTAKGGTLPYKFLWNNAQTLATATGLSSATYTIIVEDALGCSKSTTIFVENNVSPSLTVFSTPATCSTSDGIANVIAAGGLSPYNYFWNDGQTTDTATGLSSGTYTVTVTDGVECSKTATVNITSVSSFSFTISTGLNGCEPPLSTATATINGGTMPYKYLWNNGQTTATMTGLSAGIYTLTVTDLAGCSGTKTVNIENVSQLTGSLSTTVSSCANPTGSAEILVSGGVAPYDYQWNDGWAQTTKKATGLFSGTYSVVVSDSRGCMLVASADISNPSFESPVLTFSSTPATCKEADGIATAIVTGGTLPPIYTWSNGATTASISGLVSGTYSLEVSDTNQCGSVWDTIVIKSQNNLIISFVSTPATCMDADGTAAALVSDGTPPYSYMWNTGHTTVSVSGLTAGTYAVEIIDQKGCLSYDTIIVKQQNNLIVKTFAATGHCELKGEASVVSIQNGTPPYSFRWSNGSLSDVITGLSSGTYSVIVTDEKGCTNTSSVNVMNEAIPEADAGLDITISNNEQVTLQAKGGVIYSWSPSSGLSSPIISNPICHPLETTSYVVTVTDHNGCIDFDTVTVFIREPCEIAISLPTAFSPNNDGQNDIFYVRNFCIKTMVFQIFNRWGEKVFETTDAKKGWDGMYQGVPLNNGVFVYQLNATLRNDKQINQRGNITLVR